MTPDSTVTTVTMTAERVATRFGEHWTYFWTCPGCEWATKDGVHRPHKAGGYSSKAENLSIIRRKFTARPLTVAWPNGTTTLIKR